MDKKICLDSDILIEISRGNRKIIDRIKNLDANLYTTSINIFEIWTGRLKKEEEATRALIASLKKTDFDEGSAIKAGDMQIKLKEAGNLIDFRDIFIASICIENDIELFTNNKKHFERLKRFGLQLV